MGLLETEIKELRMMNKRIMEGTIKAEEVHQRIAVYSQLEKREKMMLQAFALQAKHGKRSCAGIMSSNLIGEGVMIDIGADQDEELLECPDQEKTITRHECLDYSGDAKNAESCKTCGNFSVTRRVLLPPKA